MSSPASARNAAGNGAVERRLGGGAFAAEAFTFPAFWAFGFLLFGDPDNVGRALGVGLGALLIATFGAVLAISDRTGPRDGDLVRRFVRRLAFIAAVALLVSAVTAQL